MKRIADKIYYCTAIASAFYLTQYMIQILNNDFKFGLLFDQIALCFISIVLLLISFSRKGFVLFKIISLTVVFISLLNIIYYLDIIKSLDNYKVCASLCLMMLSSVIVLYITHCLSKNTNNAKHYKHNN